MEIGHIGQGTWHGLIEDFYLKIKATLFIIISLKSLNICQKRKWGMIMNIYK